MNEVYLMRRLMVDFTSVTDHIYEFNMKLAL